MKKQNILILSLVLFSMLTTQMALAAVNLEVPDISGTTVQGTNYQTVITIQNHEDEIDILNIESTDLTGPTTISNSEITITPTEFANVGTNQTREITYQVNILGTQNTGTYTGTLTITYNDGVANATETSAVEIIVTENNHAPVFTSTPSTSGQISQPYTYDAKATDQDLDTLTFQGVQMPTGMSINSNTGIITWTPTAIGNYDVIISVTDGTEITLQEWTITVTSIPVTISFEDVEMGSTSQGRDEVITGTFIIQNTGSESITNLVVNPVADSKYEISMIPVSTIINPLSNVIVNYQVKIPEDQDAGEIDIGSVVVTGLSGSLSLTQTKDLYLITENNLEIKDMNIRIDGKGKDLDDGDDFDVKPGDEIEIDVTAENTYSDLDLEDITVLIECDDLDWDEDKDISRIRDDDDKSVTFSLSIPDDANEDDSPYSITIEVTGDDENGAEHSETIEFELNLEKEDDDIRVTDYSFSPRNPTCDDKSVRLSVEITNFGADDQDRAALMIESNELNYLKLFEEINIDEDEDLRKEVTIPFPNDVQTGEYLFDISAYTSSNDDDLTDYTTAKLYILPCENQGSNNNQDDESSNNENNQDDSGEIDIVIPSQNPSNIVSGQGEVIQTVTGKSREKVDGTANIVYIGLLAIIFLLLVVIAIFLGVYAFSKVEKNK